MKKNISIILVLALCFSLTVPAFAINETNTMGITFSASLDKPALATSDVDQSVVLTVVASSSVSTSSISYTADVASGLTVTALEGDGINVTDATTNLTTGMFSWSAAGGAATTVTTIAKMTVKVPAGTAAGSYQIGVTGIKLSKDYGMTIIENGAGAYATLTITDAPVVDGYSASITVDSAEVEVGKTGTIKVNVTNSENTRFAAGEVVLTIPSNVTIAERGAVKNAADEDVNYRVSGTTLTIEDFGEDKNLGNGVYVITYTAGNTAGNVSFALASAAFSDKTTAEKEDLIEATVDTTENVVTIINAPVTVTVDASSTDFFKFTTPASYGEDYTFYKEETTGAYYQYSAVQYKVGDGAWNDLTESNGSWTIPGSAVTGAITIKGTRDGMTYTVTWEGDGANDIINKPTAKYGVNFVVTLPADKEPDTTPGYVYSISATMNGHSIGNYDRQNRIFTILGTAITGDFTVTVAKTTQNADQFKVEISSTPNLSTDVTASNPVVNKNEPVTLTLNREAGYTYMIKVNGEDKTSEFTGDNEYTVENVQATVTVEVTKTVDITNANATYYLGMDSEEGKTMWLITIAPDANGTQLNQKHYTYNSEPMFWSEEYNAYCYLMISEATAPILVAADFAITDGVAPTVDYGKDVNMTDKVDANDAQLVYNMYNKNYSDFSTVDMEKFLRADVNGDALTKTSTTADAINVDDAAAIIAAILAGTVNSSS